MYICFTTLVPDARWHEVPNEDCYVLQFTQEEQDPKGGKATVPREYRFKFYKKVKGILPELVGRLIRERKKIKAQIAGLKKKSDKTKDDDLLLLVLDKKQFSLKLSANSFYEILGVRTGAKLGLMEGAMSITGIGRNLLETKQQATLLYGAVVVYGDTDSLMLQMPGITHPSQCNY